MNNGGLGKKVHSNGDSITTLVGSAFYGDNWGKPRPHIEPQGTNGACVIKTPADPAKVEAYRKEQAEIKKMRERGHK